MSRETRHDLGRSGRSSPVARESLHTVTLDDPDQANEACYAWHVACLARSHAMYGVPAIVAFGGASERLEKRALVVQQQRHGKSRCRDLSILGSGPASFQLDQRENLQIWDGVPCQ